MYEPVISKWTNEWSLPKIDNPLGFWGELRFVDKIPVIGCFSPEAIGGRPEDWPEHVQLADNLDIESDSSVKLDEKIEAFLQKDLNEKPVFISFGSMALADPEVLTNLALAIVEKLGKRVILSAGWVKVKEDELLKNEKLLTIAGAPYDLLFPRCSVIIHHGGAGTTGAALRAGVPHVVVAFMMDQPFWGQAMHKIGVGAKQLSYNDLKEEQVLEVVKYVDDEKIRKRAEEIGVEIRKRNGAKEAVKLIENILC